MKDLSSKMQVMVALYAEYQKDLPNMSEVTNKSIMMDVDVFYVALDKLQNEGYITGCEFYSADGNRFYGVSTENIRLTRDGINEVEYLMCLEEEKSGKERLKKLAKVCGLLGLTGLKWFIVETLKHIADIY